MKAKAIRDQKDAAARAAGQQSHSTPSGFVTTEEIRIPNTRKRAYESISRNVPSTSRDGRVNGASPPPASKDDGAQKQKDGEKEGAIRPARKFTKFVDYDFGKMTDTKGGFLSTEDDPWNKAMSGGPGGQGKVGRRRRRRRRGRAEAQGHDAAGVGEDAAPQEAETAEGGPV